MVDLPLNPCRPAPGYLEALHYESVDAKFKLDVAYESDDRGDGVSIH